MYLSHARITIIRRQFHQSIYLRGLTNVYKMTNLHYISPWCIQYNHRVLQTCCRHIYTTEWMKMQGFRTFNWIVRALRWDLDPVPGNEVLAWHTAVEVIFRSIVSIRLGKRMVPSLRSVPTMKWSWGNGYQPVYITGLILGMLPANERRRYFVTMSLIGWAQV